MGTTTFKRSLLVDTALMGVVTDTLGTQVAGVGTFDDSELGKAVKMGAASYIAASIGDEIEGIVNSVESGTRNSGYSWGGVQTKGRVEAVVDAAQTPAMAIGDIVCSGTAVANGTAGKATIISAGTGFVAPADFKWRCISLGVANDGSVGSTVLIEKI